MRKLFVLWFSLIWAGFIAPAFASLDIHTPTASEPIRLAKVYFLPDWRQDKLSFGGDDNKPCTEVCNNVSASDCAYGLTETYVNSCGETCVRCKECVGCESQGYRLSACPENGICANDCCNKLYKLTGCNSGFVKDGDGCREKICTDDAKICTDDGFVCDSKTGKCVECVTKNDCSGGQECVNNSCRCPEGEVWENDQCVEGTCTNGGIDCEKQGLVCNTGSGECVQCMIDDNCPTGKVCSENHTCIVETNPCDNVKCEGGQCVDGKCVCSGSKPHLLDDNVTCVECTDKNHCSGGRECVNNSCQCPSGTVEVKGVCETKNCNNTPSLCDPDTEKCNTSTGLCEPTTRSCQVGDILYTDQTCSPYYTRGKTPLGVIIDPKRTLVLALPEGNVPMAEPSLNSTEFTYLIADNWNTSGVSEQQILSEEGLSV